jgi:glycosyltransferase involved in cell wall biosynthesis
MGYGVPVAASDESRTERGQELFIPFREICGDAAHYFDPFDPEDMAAGLEKVIFDLEYRERLVYLAKEQVRKYNWDETAQALAALFEEACRNGAEGAR